MLAGLLAAIATAAAFGASIDAPTTILLVLTAIGTAAPWTITWLLGSLGIGLLISRALRLSTDLTLSLTIGVALHLTYAHTIGAAGWLSPVTAWAPVALGAVGIALTLNQIPPRPKAPPAPRWLWIALPGTAILLVASTSPPGWLWASEFGGYDSLSYHLALPREWLRLGRIATLETNVYSALPSFMEAGSTQLALLMGAAPSDPDPARELVIIGDWAVAAQLLHASTAIVGVWACARLGSRFIETFTNQPDQETSPKPSIPLAALLLATPWVVVSGSLSYNEMAVVLLGAGACLAAMHASAPPIARGMLAGLLLAAATGCKPTAFLFLAPTVALCMLAPMPRKAWFPAIIAGGAAGLIVLTPWLVRNALTTSNPVFPFATGLFGSGHWTAEQAARWAAAHAFDGSLTDRLQTAAWTNPHATAQAPHVERYRGLLGPQWLAFWPATIAAAGLAIAREHTRRAAAIASAALAIGLLAWLVFTHVQARFLLPLLVPAAVLLALAAHTLGRRTASTVLALLALTQAGFTLHRFATIEREGKPLLALELGQQGFLGLGLEDDPAYDPPRYVANRELGPDDLVLLVGDARAYWWLPPTVAPTTWDTHPLASIVRAHPGDPAAWLDELRQAGFTHAVIDRPELDRLAADARLDPALTADALDELIEAAPRVRRFPVGEMVYLLPTPNAENTP